MNGDVELLNYVYQNSQMGKETLIQLLEITEDATFKEYLKSQQKEYETINEHAKKLLNTHGYDEKGIGNLQKISAYLMINIKTLIDKTPSHIATMLIQGSTMGTIDAIKNIRKYEHADHKILSLMKDLLKTEENNIDELKKFL